MAKRKPLYDHHAVGEPYNPEGIWSPDITAHLIKLWTEDGLSAGAIADDLTERLNKPISRSCVSGKIARMKLVGKGARQKATGRPNGVKHGERAGVERRAAPKPIEARSAALAPATEPQELTIGGRPLYELSHFQCRYALTDRSPHRFCGEPTTPSDSDPNGSWCAAHRAIVFQPRLLPDRSAKGRAKGDGRSGAWR